MKCAKSALCQRFDNSLVDFLARFYGNEVSANIAGENCVQGEIVSNSGYQEVLTALASPYGATVFGALPGTFACSAGAAFIAATVE